MSFVGPIRSEDLNDLVRALLGAAGADSDDARLVAEQLVDAEARENRGQGLIRLRPYVTWMRNGKIASPSKLRLEREFGATLLLDGGNGWGQVVTTQAMTMCVERAQKQGVCLALVRNANHIGRLGYYVEAAAGHGLVGLVACSGHPSSAWVAPWGGTKPIFGTNPIAFGFPRKDGPPVVVDLSTTQGSRGAVLLAARSANCCRRDGPLTPREIPPAIRPRRCRRMARLLRSAVTRVMALLSRWRSCAGCSAACGRRVAERFWLAPSVSKHFSRLMTTIEASRTCSAKSHPDRRRRISTPS